MWVVSRRVEPPVYSGGDLFRVHAPKRIHSSCKSLKCIKLVNGFGFSTRNRKPHGNIFLTTSLSRTTPREPGTPQTLQPQSQYIALCPTIQVGLYYITRVLYTIVNLQRFVNTLRLLKLSILLLPRFYSYFQLSSPHSVVATSALKSILTYFT